MTSFVYVCFSVVYVAIARPSKYSVQNTSTVYNPAGWGRLGLVIESLHEAFSGGLQVVSTILLSNNESDDYFKNLSNMYYKVVFVVSNWIS